MKGWNWFPPEGFFTTENVRFGHKRTWRLQIAMSALPPIADIPRRYLDVRYGPQADMRLSLLHDQNAAGFGVKIVEEFIPARNERSNVHHTDAAGSDYFFHAQRDAFKFYRAGI
jgi:hypothetical protein